MLIPLSEARMKLGDLVENKLPREREIYLSKYNRPIAKIVPVRLEDRRARLRKALKKHYGSIPDFPEVHKMRYSRKKSLEW